MKCSAFICRCVHLTSHLPNNFLTICNECGKYITMISFEHTCMYLLCSKNVILITFWLLCAFHPEKFENFWFWDCPSPLKISLFFAGAESHIHQGFDLCHTVLHLCQQVLCVSYICNKLSQPGQKGKSAGKIKTILTKITCGQLCKLLTAIK